MKQFFLVFAVSVTISMSAAAQAKTKTAGNKKPEMRTGGIKPMPSALKTSLDSFSYALGMNIANNLKQQNIDVISFNAMQKGMDAVFKKQALAITEQQANNCIQQRIQGNMSKNSNAEKAKGKAFLDANKKRKEVISLPSGLQYEVIKKGDETSALPKLEDTVVANYSGTLINGKEFDNSYKRGEPLSIPCGGVIRGWTEALQLMHIGDKWKVYIPSELGYGDRGAGADIPGGSTLIFEMELLGIKPAAVTPAPAEEKKEQK